MRWTTILLSRARLAFRQSATGDLKMATMTTEHAERSFVETYWPLISFVALVGIPAAGSVALVFSLQILRFIDGAYQPLPLAAEVGSLLTVAILFFMLRACLALPSAPRGAYRNVLDFLAMARWHPAVKATFIALVVLPGVWYLHGSHWLVITFRTMGRRALKSGDVQDGLDGLTAVYQLALTGGVPLLFGIHMFSRWKPKNRFLPWLLMPLFLMGTAIGVVLLVAIAHH
jgi:hypothetical protein